MRRWVRVRRSRTMPSGPLGEAEALEGGEDVAAGGPGGASFGEEPFELLVGAEGVAEVGFDQPKDDEGETDDADEGVDAVVVVEEDGPHPQGGFGVVVADLSSWKRHAGLAPRTGRGVQPPVPWPIVRKWPAGVVTQFSSR